MIDYDELSTEIVHLIQQQCRLRQALLAFSSDGLGQRVRSALREDEAYSRSLLLKLLPCNVNFSIHSPSQTLADRVRVLAKGELQQIYVGDDATPSAARRLAGVVRRCLAILYPRQGNASLGEGFWCVSAGPRRAVLGDVTGSGEIAVEIIPASLQGLTVEISQESDAYRAEAAGLFVVGGSDDEALITLGLTLQCGVRVSRRVESRMEAMNG